MYKSFRRSVAIRSYIGIHNARRTVAALSPGLAVAGVLRFDGKFRTLKNYGVADVTKRFAAKTTSVPLTYDSALSKIIAG